MKIDFEAILSPSELESILKNQNQCIGNDCDVLLEYFQSLLQVINSRESITQEELNLLKYGLEKSEDRNRRLGERIIESEDEVQELENRVKSLTVKSKYSLKRLTPVKSSKFKTAESELIKNNRELKGKLYQVLDVLQRERKDTEELILIIQKNLKNYKILLRRLVNNLEHLL